jgi:hypothetical protein
MQGVSVTPRTLQGEVVPAGALLELQANPILSSNLDCAIAEPGLP